MEPKWSRCAAAFGMTLNANFGPDEVARLDKLEAWLAADRLERTAALMSVCALGGYSWHAIMALVDAPE